MFDSNTLLPERVEALSYSIMTIELKTSRFGASAARG